MTNPPKVGCHWPRWATNYQNLTTSQLPEIGFYLIFATTEFKKANRNFKTQLTVLWLAHSLHRFCLSTDCHNLLIWFERKPKTSNLTRIRARKRQRQPTVKQAVKRWHRRRLKKTRRPIPLTLPLPCQRRHQKVKSAAACWFVKGVFTFVNDERESVVKFNVIRIWFETVQDSDRVHV